MFFIKRIFLNIYKSILRNISVTLAIICMLALGTGGVTAVFNPIYSMLFTPLPFPHPEQLVRIGGDIRMFNIRNSRFEKEEFLGRIFSSVAAYAPSAASVRVRVPETGKHKDVYSLLVTENFFETLGVQPLMGSGFNSAENKSGVVISYRFWRNEMMQADDAIGGNIYLGMRPATIVGIMPESYNFPSDTDIWQCRSSGTSWEINNATQFIGRLRIGMPSGQAAKELQAIDFNPVPGIIGFPGPVLQSLQTFLYGDQHPMLRILGAAAILFFILVCTGVVNILITQGTRRKQEIAIRLIHGAMRRNLVFQLLIEVLPLVVVGGLVGWWLSEFVSMLSWTQLPALQNSTVNLPIKITFWVALVLGMTLIGGLIPSLYATSLDLNTYLKSANGGKRHLFSSREFLVGVQLGLALALLINMGVLVRSMMFRVDFPVGWSSKEIAVVSAYPLEGIFMTAEESSTRYAKSFQDIQNELGAMPEVLSVGYLSIIPFSANATSSSQIPQPTLKTLPPQGQGWPPGTPAFIYVMASPGGFDVLDIPLVIGRPFTEADVVYRLENFRIGGYGRVGGVAIINQEVAKILWPRENAIGKVFYDASSSAFEVVGVVRNYYQKPGDDSYIPTVYTPMTGASTASYKLMVKLRPGTSLKIFQSNVQQRLSSLAVIPTEFEVKPLSEHVKDAMMERRLTLQLLGIFAILGITISGLAVYATATLMASARTKETGIRMAMGATAWDIIKFTFWRGVRAIIIGLPLGLFMAWILSKVLSSFLVQVNIGDPVVWGISCAVLLIIVTVAALIPALRATCVNPLDVLKNE